MRFADSCRTIHHLYPPTDRRSGRRSTLSEIRLNILLNAGSSRTVQRWPDEFQPRPLNCAPGTRSRCGLRLSLLPYRRESRQVSMDLIERPRETAPATVGSSGVISSSWPWPTPSLVRPTDRCDAAKRITLSKEQIWKRLSTWRSSIEPIGATPPQLAQVLGFGIWSE